MSGDAVKWNNIVFSVVSAVRTYSTGPHLPAPFWCWRVFGQCENGGDHLFRRFLSETTEMLNRISSVGALCQIRCSPPGAKKFDMQNGRVFGLRWGTTLSINHAEGLFY